MYYTEIRGGIRMEIHVIETKTVPTIQVHLNNKKIFLHSKYDPLKEADIWIEKEKTRIQDNKLIVVIGLGAGYHIQKLAEAFPTHSITVLEFNELFYNWFIKSSFTLAFKKYPNVQIKLGSNLSASEQKQLFNNTRSSNILIHKSGTDLLTEDFAGIKVALEDIKMQQRSLQVQEPRLVENFNNNLKLHDEGIMRWKNQFENRPMILVSAGPSLDKQLPLLKTIREEDSFIIGAVGTAIKPLLKAGIVPHFFSIIDPNPATLNQLKGVQFPDTPLFYLSSAYFETVALHQGPKYMMCQQGFSLAEERAKQNNEPLIQTGGSVATALLDLMVYLGGKTIALIGQDLAYTDGKTHAEAAHDQKIVQEHDRTRYTLDYYQNAKVPTAQNLLLYKKWFENYALQHTSLTLYNCTEGGAHIENWRHIPFRDFYEMYKNNSTD